MRSFYESRHAKALAVWIAAAVVTVMIVLISANLQRIHNSLPQYGFFNLRDLHIMLRDLTHLRDVAELATAAPGEQESLDKLSKANDLVYIRFVRLDRGNGMEDLPGNRQVIADVKSTVEQIDALLAAGLPFDKQAIEAVNWKLAGIERRMNEIYYAYGEASNHVIAEAQSDLIRLNVMIAIALGLLAVLGIGTSLLLVNRHGTLKMLEFLAWRDTLTGLRNRAWLTKNIDAHMAAVRTANGAFSLCLIDLDHFKGINDAHGHHVGDMLLKSIAGQLRQLEEECDGAIGLRLGGDEFALIVPDTPGAGEAIAGFSARTNGLINLGGHQIDVGTSIGVARFPEQAGEIDTLLRHADCALYAAKTKGRSCIVAFSQELLDNANRKLQTEAGLRRAIANDEFFLVWQPQFDLVTGLISGAEALLRWRDGATGEIVSPTAFIPVAQQSNLILEIDTLVLRKACTEAAMWHRLLPTPPTCSVNISSQQLQSPSFAAEVAALLRETGLPPEKLELEITEGSVIENKLFARSVLCDIQKLGVFVALDDFGTGYSSLSYLPELPVNRLKIDRSFVDGLENTPRKETVVRTIMALARSLNMAVVAEGIETDEQMAVLRREKCEFGQGFYLSRPLDGTVLLVRLGHGCQHYADWQRHAAANAPVPQAATLTSAAA